MDLRSSAKKQGSGCLKGAIYALVVLLLAGALSYVLIVGGLDLTGITRSDTTVDITIPAGANTEKVAQVLVDNGLIDQPLFRGGEQPFGIGGAVEKSAPNVIADGAQRHFG